MCETLTFGLRCAKYTVIYKCRSKMITQLCSHKFYPDLAASNLKIIHLSRLAICLPLDLDLEPIFTVPAYRFYFD